MAIPTSGSYSGLYLYQGTDISTLGGAVATALTGIETVLETNPEFVTILSDVGYSLADLVEIYQPIASDATVTFSPGSLSTGTTTLSDTAVLQSGANAVEFQSGTSAYVLSNGPAEGLSVDDTLTELGNLAATLGGTLGAGTVLSALFGTLKTALDVLGLGGADILPSTTFDGSPYEPPCFARGTSILTVRGEVLVENLEIGDRVVLEAGGSAPIIWIGRRRMEFAPFPADETRRPVRIRRGALGGGLPRRDLVLSPDHAVLVDEVLVPAGLLVNGDTIRSETIERIEYFHVELATHAVLIAEGAPAETYRDTGNRSSFSNARLVALRPEPVDPVTLPDNGSCAELVLGGPRLTAIRARLAASAEAQQPEPLRLAG